MMTTHRNLIFAMRKPHKVGTVCGAPVCEQCGGAKTIMTDGNLVNPIPLLIIREATYEEWAAQVGPQQPGRHGNYFYEVTTD